VRNNRYDKNLSMLAAANLGKFGALVTNRIVAVGLLAEDKLSCLGKSLKCVWKVDETPCFGSLLSAIDEADRELWRERDPERARS